MKEWRLLGRDRFGLLMLFIMPALLVIVISVVQMNVLKTMGDEPVALLWVDRDRGDIARLFRERLAAADGIVLVDRLEGSPIDEAGALGRVTEGEYQVCIVIPQGISKGVHARSQEAAKAMLASPGQTSPSREPLPEITVYFDPLASGAFRSAVSQALQRLVAGIETETKLKAFADHLPEKLADTLSEALGPYASTGLKDELSGIKLKWDPMPLMALAESSAGRGGYDRIPSAVQQNVPAWGLFGIFFIAVPLSGALVRERNSGIMIRLQLLPTSFLTMLTGKLVAYGAVCMAQFALMMLVGRFIMPLFGAEPLTLAQAYGGLGVVLFCVALAATAFGILLGVATRTFEQASMIGAVAVVIAAAIGGVMVPVFAMPQVMRSLSQISPMAWGLNALLDLFARGGSLATVWTEAAMLLCFAAVMLLSAWMIWNRQRR
jgi:ABC-2 type transport system permease protein